MPVSIPLREVELHLRGAPPSQHIKERYEVCWVFSRSLGKTGNGSWPHTPNVLFQDLKRRPSCTPSPQRAWLTRWPRLAARGEWNAAPATRPRTWRTVRRGSGEAAETTSNMPTSLWRTSWANAPTKTCAHAWTCTTPTWAWRLVGWFRGWSLVFPGGVTAPTYSVLCHQMDLFNENVTSQWTA